MSDEKKTYTVEDVREAFVDGAEWEVSNLSERDYNRTRANEIAVRRYPSPKKLREVGDANGEDVFYFADNRLWGRNTLGHCRPVAMYAPTHDRIKLWADLLDHPYEGDR
jgi:hypothetical protein